MDNQYLWKRIKALCKQKNMSLRKLTREGNIPMSTLFNLENGRSKNPSFSLIKKIADTLDVSLDEFR
ncbi:helix-turn-helix domain-containing protein [Secundilactobacillus kimchicus]|uniref:helix-turn-helix domain-containing protein n=1 Tax=Secundilactobacillus kimchicus TaxID=528209 RepID=UPI0024A918F3|nr:helix-turn-helix transcriptional regulator [Secundilactobacillus kimchicus]